MSLIVGLPAFLLRPRLRPSHYDVKDTSSETTYHSWLKQSLTKLIAKYAQNTHFEKS